MILDLDLTSKDEDLKPFWNEVSEEFHRYLWQPTKTELPDRATPSSKRLLNYQEEELSFWKKTVLPKNLTPNRLSVSLQATLTHIMGSGRQVEKRKMLTSKKVRVFPEDETKMIRALHTYRRAYNITIEAINNNEPTSSELRRRILETIREEDDGNHLVDVNMIYEAYRKAVTSFQNGLKKFKATGKPFKLSFMSWKYSPRYFINIKLSKNGQFPRIMGKIHYTETIPDEAFGKQCIMKYENGEWYVCLQQSTTISAITETDKRIVALDPGVRTFMTSFSDSQVNKYGDEFSKETLMPLALSLSKMISERDTILGSITTETMTQYDYDKLRYYEKKINNLRNKRKHLVNDLHKRVAYDIVQNNDIILLPSFETSNMVSKDGNGKRKLRRKTIRAMLDLSHYKFKTYIKYLAEKYGKVVIDVNEAYTSKTINGKIYKIGSKKSLKVGKETYDRDINGARNILLRFITTHI